MNIDNLNFILNSNLRENIIESFKNVSDSAEILLDDLWFKISNYKFNSK
ncbi:hypothetical protein [Spiroplasma taiwanense]|uniref:Uncharacterized protein n=1 Tax=Spiroplasma taiwanense CT-1 TaxID=1276220 RepID=S5MGN3_9MOLU|nr:hypothetical protein [Spiroplasma taiwanense]AGR41010.1 hypothetical protein STAIW_v1c03520 [Spiroplasma taiwanense CT-1]